MNFVDLNKNNLSEKITGYIKGEALFIINDDNNNIVDQWTFSSNLNSNFNPYWFYDTDNNGYKEIYFTSQSSDSVFLNIVEPISVNGINTLKKKVFVDTMHKYKNKYTVESYGAKFSKYIVNGVHEVFFTLGAGFAGYPRNVYKYNIKNNTIEKSEHLTNVSIIRGFEDINDDGFEDIMFKSYSYGNKLDSAYTHRSDNSLWLNVLDHNLNYLFKPVEFKVSNSDCKVIPFYYEGEHYIVVNLHSRHKDISPSKLMLFSNKGEVY